MNTCKNLEKFILMINYNLQISKYIKYIFSNLIYYKNYGNNKSNLSIFK